MLTKGKTERDSLEIVSIEMLVPQDHLLRKIDRAVDFAHIYDFTESLYCADNGCPGIDPVVLFKMVLIQHLYGLPSLRRTVEEISMNDVQHQSVGEKADDFGIFLFLPLASTVTDAGTCLPASAENPRTAGIRGFFSACQRRNLTSKHFLHCEIRRFFAGRAGKR